MSLLSDSPRTQSGNPETVHFPWAHVDDFHRFFGIDRLLDYSQKKKNVMAKRITQMLVIRSTQHDIRTSLNLFAARAIVIGQALETLVDVRGKLASYIHLDRAVRISHPELAAYQRKTVLAAYLYENEIIESPDLAEEMNTNRLSGLLAHHAPGFWHNEHEDLFELAARLQNALQVRYLASSLLKALPQQAISDAKARQMVNLFADWEVELKHSIAEAKASLDDTPAAITMRANLQQIQKQLHAHAFA